MLEIILLIKLCSMVSGRAKAKGRMGWPYGLMLFVMWICGEFGGALAGLILFGEGLPVYAMAIGGAALAAVIAFVIVGALPPVEKTPGRWQRAEEVFNLDECDPACDLRRGDQVFAPVEIVPGDLLRIGQADDGRVRIETVFEDEAEDLPGPMFRVERSAYHRLPHLVKAKAPGPRPLRNGDGYPRRSTHIQEEPPAD